MNNWEINLNPLSGKHYKDKEEALATAAMMVMKEGVQIILNDEIMELKRSKKKTEL